MPALRPASRCRSSIAETRRRIDEHLPAYGTSQNPVDATAQAVFKIGYAGLGGLVVPSPAVDGIIVVMTARSAHNLERQREALTRLAAETAKPILMWSYTLPAPRSVEILSEAGYPLYTSIQTCARTLRAMADYRALRERFLRPIEADERVRAGQGRGAGGAGGSRHGALRVGGAADPGVLRHRHQPRRHAGRLRRRGCRSAAKAIGGAVALKVQSPDILHKTEAGAVALNLASAEAVRAAYDRVLASARRHAPDARIRGVLVQPMAPPGREVILGVKRDATFGPLLMVGLGGVQVEILKDVALSPVPLGASEARDLLARLKGAPLLDAHRGTPPGDVDALVELMVRLSQFAADHADAIAEIDLNPVLVHARGKGVSVVDALIVKRDPLSPSSRGEG